MTYQTAHPEFSRRPTKRLTDQYGQILNRGEASALSEGRFAPPTEDLPPDRYTGITITTRRRGRAVQINMRQQGGKNVRSMALLLGLQVSQVMEALLLWRENSHAIRSLHDQIPASWPGSLTRARHDLMSANPYGRNAQQLPRGSFRISGGLDRPILLPLTPDFERNYQTNLIRRAELQAGASIRAPLEAVMSHIAQIHARNTILDGYVDGRRDLIAPRMRDLALLQALDLMLATMVRYPKSAPDADDGAAVTRFREQLDNVLTSARDVMVDDPVGYEWWTQQISETASETIALVRDRGFARNIAAITQHWGVVPQSDRDRIGSVMLTAYRLLLTSPSEANAMRDLEAVLNQISASADPARNIPSQLPAGFRAVIAAPASQTAPQIALGYLALAAGTGGRTVANIPGPNSFAVALLNVAGPALMAKTQDHRAAANLGGRIFRAVRATTRLDDDEVDNLLRHVARRNPEGMAEARSIITSKWPGRRVGGALILLNIFAMLSVWQSNDRLTLRNWADLIGSGTSAALGAARILSTMERLEGSRVVGSLVSGTAGKALGVIGGTLAIYSGVEMARDEFGSGDMLGGGLAVADVAGGVMSVVGFLMVAGAANAWNGIGEVLMLIGAIIGIVAFVWSSLRDYFRTGPKRVAEGMLAQFRRSDGAFALIGILANDMPEASQRRVRQLQQQVTRLGRSLNNTDFWEISLNGAQTLLDLDFCPPHIAVLTDEDEDAVIGRLRREGRWNAQDRARCRAQTRATEALIEESKPRSPMLADDGAGRKLTADEVRYLVLEGGGGKGLVFMGSLAALAAVPVTDGGTILGVTNGRLNRIRGVAGSSAGAITALGLSCGMTIAQLAQLSSQNFQEFFDLPARPRQVPVAGRGCVNGPSPDLLDPLLYDPISRASTASMGSFNPVLIPMARYFSQWVSQGLGAAHHTIATAGLRRNDSMVRKLTSPAMPFYARNLWQDLGLFSGCAARRFLGNILAQRGGAANMTFAQHDQRFTTKLVVTGSNIETGRTELFSAEHTPQMAVADAVRISMGLPLLFKPYRIGRTQAAAITRGGRVRNPTRYQGLWVDGGLWNNLPMTAFARDEAGTPGTLGLLLGTSHLARRRTNSFPEYMTALASRVLADEGQANTNPSYREQIIALDTGDIGTTDFAPDPNAVARLQAAAGARTVAYFR